MEFDEIIVKESPGLCRCCLSEGCYKDLGSEYTWMNETEVYADMLLECFDIGISQHNDGPNGPNRLICEVCITRLRDACNFKKQVLDSEKKFVDMVGRGEFRPKVMVYQAMMKAETLPEEALVEDGEVEYLDEIFEEEPLKSDDVAPEASVSDDISLAALAKGKRGRPKKNSVKSEKKVKVAKLDDKPKTSRTVTRGGPRGGQKSKADKRRVVKHSGDVEVASGNTTSARPTIFAFGNTTSGKPTLTVKEKRKIMRSNVIQVLLKSTVMPFRWLKTSYRCFYCYNIYQEADDLKEHQHVHSDDTVKIQAMNNFWESVVYVDISEMSCKLCSERIDDLYVLIDHLVEKHGVVYNKDVGICIIAFRLSSMYVKCVTCGLSYFSFGPLLLHTNKAHKGASTILCDICGQHFKDSALLRLHVKTLHENTGVLCNECGETFETRSKLKTHQKKKHDVEKKCYKCLVCTQTFQSHYMRSRHMAAEHKNRSEVKCPHCTKTFVFRSMMMTHLRDSHLKVRNHLCSVCGWKAFSSSRLKNHMYKHSGEKNFKCDACSKAFTTKKIMRAHFARMHKTAQVPIMPYENPYVGH